MVSMKNGSCAFPFAVLIFSGIPGKYARLWYFSGKY